MSINVDPDWWKSLFDDVYLMTDARSVCNDNLTRGEVDLFCRLIPLEHGDRILDLCGGQGRHSLELSRRGFTRCTVVDYSQILIDNGIRSAASCQLPVRFIRGDARKLDMETAYFNHVMILGNSLGYVQDAEADDQILKESFRVLQPGGWLLLDVTDGSAVRERFLPNAWHEIGDDLVVCRQRELREDYVCAREMVMKKSGGMIRDRTYGMRLYDAGSLKDLVSRCGFELVQAHTNFSPMEIKGDLGFMNYRILITAQKPN
jgi:D-alanine-D-alanine ligase